MSLQAHIIEEVTAAVKEHYGKELPSVELQATRKDFEGDITVVIFPMLSHIKGNPVEIGQRLGEHLQTTLEEVSSYNIIKGFLNLVLSDSYYLEFFDGIKKEASYGTQDGDGESYLVEYSSPNTNKPLHLGHIRNNLLGYSVSRILEAAGKEVHKIQIINDRGIHICKSMLAWQRSGKNESPESTGLKGDKLVGNYYVAYDQVFKDQVAERMAFGLSREEAEKEAPILLDAKDMLRKWEAGDEEVVSLWRTMNSWVYEGFNETYANLGVEFDKLYYESETYLLGKDIVAEGLQKEVFFKKDDGSVWIDLTDDGLDEKIVLRADGTSVYMTQDLGTAVQRAKDFPGTDGMVYTVGNEQDYHFRVLFLILKKLGYSWAESLFHLSYGMVDLPSGKMKSREGTVVDADDLILEMASTAEEISQELGKLEGYSEEEKKELYRKIGLGALKYFILKVDPKKRILFDPKESVDFQGNTGPFIQYTYARIQSILRKAGEDWTSKRSGTNVLHPKEKELLKALELFPDIVNAAAEQYSPALVANYVYELVKEFNSFYQQVTILGETNEEIKTFRIQLANKVGEVIKTSLNLLGIEAPQRM
ncbi:MAG: arginine--tRNA ligase [Eudoraea sp.]|nr:arginine--tRNA ligase [Eudoraea sp.]